MDTVDISRSRRIELFAAIVSKMWGFFRSAIF